MESNTGRELTSITIKTRIPDGGSSVRKKDRERTPTLILG
jgi:hypothetical protein